MSPFEEMLENFARVVRQQDARRHSSAAAFDGAPAEDPVQDSIVELVANLARDDAPRSLRFETVYRLGQINDPRSAPPLLAVLACRSEDPEVRGLAAEQLGNIDDVDVIDALVAALFDEHDVVRFDAAWVLAEARDERARRALTTLVDDAARPHAHRSESVGEIARRALRRLESSP